MKKFLLKYSYLVFIFLIALFYIKNLTHDVFGVDVGDLVSAAAILGVPHAPGYPLFVILGHLLLSLSLSFPPVWKVGLISVAASVGTLIFYYKFALKGTKDFFISILSTLILAFSYLFWFYTEIPEVFALNAFFAIAILWFALRFLEKKKFIHLYILSFLLGLSATHHQTIVFVFPIAAYVLYKQRKFLLKNKKKALYSIFFLLFGLTPLLYIPIAASRKPLINWNEASTLQGFLHLITRQDYGTFVAGPFPKITFSLRFILLKQYFETIISSATFPSFVLCLIGAAALYKKNTVRFFSFFVPFVLAGPFFVFYSGFQITDSFWLGISERFYVFSSLMLLLYLPYGFLVIKNLASKFLSKKIYVYLILFEFLFIPFTLFRYNLPKTDLSLTSIGNNLGIDMLNLPKNTAVVMGGDNRTFNSWYVQHALKMRPDIIIMHQAGAGNNYYFNEERAAYLVKNKKSTDSNEIIAQIFLQIYKKRPLFSVEAYKINDTVVWVPRGLSHELMAKKDLPAKEEYVMQEEALWKKLHVPYKDDLTLAEQSLVTSTIPQEYSDSLVKIGNFMLVQYQDKDQAVTYYKKAIAVDPRNAKAYASMAIALSGAQATCNEAIRSLTKSIALAPGVKDYYEYLYLTYISCQKDKKIINALRAKYLEVFGLRIENEVKKLGEDLKR